MKYAHMDTSRVELKTVSRVNENESIMLSLRFKYWYQGCLSKITISDR
ncbi:MAG: hypothetical protein ACJA13_002516 [Paraglaciecola sp.]|jgi:hypothetical protein